MARRSIDFLCMLSQPRNLIDFPLYIYPFEDRGCREIRFRACGIDQKLWIFHRLDIMSFICFLYLYFFCTKVVDFSQVRSAEDAQLIEDVRSATKYELFVGTLEGHIKISSNSMLKTMIEFWKRGAHP
ncbi:hypothetical protein LXL04_039513 [Taraxacum kok-saghyz]